MPIQKNIKQLYKLTFTTDFSFQIELTVEELKNLIRTKKIIGYKKIVIDNQ
jgi:hypothetical protein